MNKPPEDGNYICTCGRVFPHPYVRIAHATECIHMAMENKIQRLTDALHDIKSLNDINSLDLTERALKALEESG